MKNKGVFSAAILTAVLCFSGALLGDNLADYMPLSLGSYWTYQSADDSNDIYTESVFEQLVFNGHPAVKFGTNSDFVIGDNNGSSVTIYQAEGVNVVPPISIGNFSDGSFFNFLYPTDFVLLRMYDNLDPSLKAVYGIDPSLTNLVLWVTYDSDYPKNSQNSIVESNLGITIPNYAVTYLEWYAKGVGKIVALNVDAASGNIATPYELIAHNIVTGPDLSGEYWFGSLSADVSTNVPWGKRGTVTVTGNNWNQEWDDYDGHHTFSSAFTTTVQPDGSININLSSGAYNVAWNGNVMIHADATPDANNRLGIDIITRKATNVDVNDLVGEYRMFAHWRMSQLSLKID
jgi:hypothetical protein